MLMLRRWRRQGRFVLLWSVGVFVATSFIIGESANQTAEQKSRTAEDAQVAKESIRTTAKPEGNVPSPDKSFLKQLFDGGNKQESSETKLAIWTPTETPVPSSPTQSIETRYIKGNRVAFRAGPGTTHKVLARFNIGRELEFMGERAGNWSRFRDRISKQEGWIATRLTTRKMPDTKPPRKQKKIRPQKTAVKKRDCHPSYSGCLDPNASDYDCAGGRGNGPKYTGRVRVLGPDVFRLDRDNDGIGCE